MQDIVGEKSLYHNINFVQPAQVPENKKGLIHLCNFQLFLDNLNRAVNPNGVAQCALEIRFKKKYLIKFTF